MKAASIKELKQELKTHTSDELLEICLQLSKFKKDNKELLSYLLFEAGDEAAFIENVKSEIELQLQEINRNTYYFMKKGIRKVLRLVKKNIQYSKKKETEVALLIHFCKEIKALSPSIKNNVTLQNIYDRQIVMIRKAIGALHEDLQYDYELELEKI